MLLIDCWQCLQLVPPSERRTAKGRNKSDKKVHSTMSLAKFLQCSEADACERMGVSLEVRRS